MIVKADIHSHILPGIDDGAETFEESVEMLRAAKTAGIEKIFATPHVRSSHFDRVMAMDACELIKSAAEPLGMELALGYELHCDALAEIGFKKADDYCLFGTNRILLEFNSYALPARDEKIICALQREGLNIIIAHPERYLQVQDDPARAERWLELGCELQISAGSLCKGIFNKEKKCAALLLNNDMAQFIASDAHCASDYEIFGRVLANIKDKDKSQFASL